MTDTALRLIDTAKLEPRYTIASSASDQAATNKGEGVRIYAVTVHDGRDPITKFDRKAWLIERIYTSRWEGEESPVVEQSLFVSR